MPASFKASLVTPEAIVLETTITAAQVPVFDGYVVKITGDSIIFKETVQDRLGKSFTREVTKKITTPAV